MKDRIKQIRKNLNLSQDEFAEKLSLSRNFVWMVEKGEREASDRTIRDICRIYGVNEIWLRTGEGEMYAPLSREEEVAKIADSILDDDTDSQKRTELIKIIADMDQADMEILYKYAQRFVDAVEAAKKDLPPQ